MSYEGHLTREQVESIPCPTELSGEEVFEIMNALVRE